MEIRDGFAGAVGNTPLIRLESSDRETGCEILGKAEFLNPGGSVKDRAALYIIRDAERRGALKPGGTVVEGTAGNTGIGLAHICNARGYRCVIYMPDNAVAGKDGPAAHARRRGAPGARRAVQRPRQLPEARRTRCRRRWPTRSGPTSSTTWSIAMRTTKRPGPRSGATRTGGSMHSSARPAPAARSPASLAT